MSSQHAINHSHHNYDYYHGHDHDHDHFYFHVGFGGFGFGSYHGHGHRYYHGYFHRHYPYYYPYYYGYSYYYPYCGVYFPYYWSYRYYPFYRRHYYYPVATYSTTYIYLDDDGSAGYRGKGYLPPDADDPYVDPDVEPESQPSTNPSDAKPTSDGALTPIEETRDPAKELSSNFVDGVEAGTTAADAFKRGDELMKSDRPLEAADAYRQAYLRDESTRSDAAMKMSIALLRHGDYPLSSWSMVKAIGGSEKRMLDYAVAMDEIAGGPAITAATKKVEKYLIDNPNDEASSLLLGSLYVMTGKPFAGHIILTRLRAAEYEPETVALFIRQAEAALR